ncbi:MAG: exodeoxyribonuclease VII small subunit [Candidatus Eremiobacteraeota bacterium]|nr:exodeoxyribonuclease VII small subunit [Candidatus Eremiobacteraeota bacterium]
MADQTSGAFESKVARLEAIVKELENGNVELERAVALFKEGKQLSRDCETLLKVAQEQIDRAMGGTLEAAPTDDVPF